MIIDVMTFDVVAYRGNYTLLSMYINYCTRSHAMTTPPTPPPPPRKLNTIF